MDVYDVLLVLLVYIIGTLVSLVITGFMVNKFVIKKVMENKDVQDIVKLIKDAKDALLEHNQNGKS